MDSRIFYYILCLLLGCGRYLEKKDPAPKEARYFLKPIQIQIEIDSLSTVSSRMVGSPEGEKEEIRKELVHLLRWLETRARNRFAEDGILLTNQVANGSSMELRILDLGEVRPRVFLEGLSVGLVLGFLAGAATGNEEIGLAVFLSEVVEEVVILKVLKSFFYITTIEMTLRDKDGLVMDQGEFRTYRNRDYAKTVPESLQNTSEVGLRSNLDASLRNISHYLKSKK